MYGIHARGEVQLGKASEVIEHAATSYQPDLIVLGARGEHEPRIAPAALGGTGLGEERHEGGDDEDRLEPFAHGIMFGGHQSFSLPTLSATWLALAWSCFSSSSVSLSCSRMPL